MVWSCTSVARPSPRSRPDGGSHLVGCLHLDAEVVEGTLDCLSPGSADSISTSFRGGSAMAKLAYPGPTLGRFGPEQLGVELDRRVDVGDVERELDSGHQLPPKHS